VMRLEGNGYYCGTCVYDPPSSFGGKPCCVCWPEDPLTSCYCKKEDVEEDEL